MGEWPPRFHMEMTPAEAGQFLRRLGECCRDWDAFEKVATGFINDALKAEPPKEPSNG